MSDTQGRFIWYELLTGDVAGAKRFYDAVVGWDIEGQSAMPGMDYRMIRRSDGGEAGGVMALSAEMTARGARPGWLGYLSVEDVDVTVAAVQADGGAVHMPPTTMDGIGRMALVTDPQGAPFYVMAPAPPADQQDAASDVFSVDRPQHVRWNELSSSDDDAAIAFYTRHFGWTQEGAMPMGELGDYRFLQQGGVGIGAVMRLMPGMPASMWTYYIGVDDIDRAAEAIGAGGGTLLQQPIQIPGGEYSLVGVDPQGATFGLVGPRHEGASA
jgi:predicted enzyme related to lactoylglutathione lyase